MKLKPHKGVYKIRIYKTHGKRVPMSTFITDITNYTTNSGSWVSLVNDTTRVPTTSVDFSTGEELTAFMTSEFRKVGFEPYPPKPSLWQRIKRKVKR